MKVIYAGTFDPPTLGHIDVINTALDLGFQVCWLFAINDEKKPMFFLKDRIKMAQDCYMENPKVYVDFTTGLVVDYAKENKIPIMIRSFRNSIDIAYELEIQQNNKVLAPNITTIFIPPKTEHIHVSSSAVRMLIKNGHMNLLEYYCPEEVKRWIEYNVRDR